MTNQDKHYRRRAMRGIAASPCSLLPAPRSSRRGILLLVVLSLLVLFLLVGTSFVVSSNQYRRASKMLNAPYEPSESPLQHADLAEEVLGQLVRDTTNQYSALRYHSLLRDLYGDEGLVIGPSSPQGVQFVNRGDFEYENSAGNPVVANDLDGLLQNLTGDQFFWAAVNDPNNRTLSRLSNYYNGRVFTFLDGPARGRSARVVRYDYRVNPSDGREFGVFVLMFVDSDRHFTSLQLNIQPTETAVLNGQPFNGTGVGYNPDPTLSVTDAKLSALEEVFEIDGNMLVPRLIALMPNATTFGIHSVTNNYGAEWMGQGGSDESYDAVDFQNMALALSPVSPGETALPQDNVLVNRGLDDTLGTSDDRPLVLPSFHRPALINYWRSQLITGLAGSTQFEPNLLRKVLMRPNWMDHPEFTGSNPDYTVDLQAYRGNQGDSILQTNLLNRMIYGPWDVDNDNDGRRDSVWVDFGAPVMMSPQGRLVKPLAAILCLDMDGRLNLNAHGTRQLVGLDGDPNAQPIAGTMTFGVMSNQLPRGQGYGPAEISLEPVLGANLFRRLLQGVNRGDTLYFQGLNPVLADRDWPGRYGLISSDGLPGWVGAYDLLAQMKQQGLPQTVAGGSTDPNDWLGNYATPPDLKGRYAVGLNDLGQPVYEVVGDPVNLDQDSPYELDLSRLGPNAAGDSAKDGPFSLGELERILRAYDRDSGKLPPRLWELANRFRTNNSGSQVDVEELNEWRALLTTDSFDLPVPSVVVPEWMRNANALGAGFETVMGKPPVNLVFADMLEYRLRLGGLSGAGLEREMRKMLAPELADGLRLDLNRPFGNGRDDNNNGVVDEPGEIDPGLGVEGPSWRVDGSRAGMNEAVGSTASFTDPNTSFYHDNFDRNGNGVVGTSDPNDGFATAIERDNFRRQLFARHLYVLAMTLVDPPSVNTTPDVVKARARHLAQWAINAADFRDPDNIMTAFEYDVNPFNGWDPDGDLSTVNDIYGADEKFDTQSTVSDDQGGIVWGLERPEVLMTETLSWHDRATEDRGTGFEDAVTDENADGKMDSNDEGEVGTLASTGHDTDFDQRVRPQGATFIELYNPHPASTAANADTHLLDPTTGEDLGINLARVSAVAHPTNPNAFSPVWRINVRRTVDFVIVNGNPNASLSVGGPDHDPDDPDSRVQPLIPDRCIYFTNFDPERFYPIDPLTQKTLWDDDGVAFYSSLTDRSANVDPIVNPNYATHHAVVRPGKYMVVGSGTDYSGSNSYEARIGEKQPRRSGSHRAVVLNPFPTGTQPSVMVRDSSGNPVIDQDGFSVSADPNVPGFSSAGTSVAVIDRIWFRNVRAGAILNEQEERRRFSVSEPATGYPDSIFNSEWTGSGNLGLRTPIDHNNPIGVYRPTLDIPLDNQRSGRIALGADNTIDGQSVIGTQKVRWFRRAHNGERIPTVELQKDHELRLTLSEQEESAVRTIPAFSWLYLQRLANPLLPWNPEAFLANGQANPKHDPDAPVNPYRTVDSMATNVTVFTGQADREKRLQNGEVLDFNNAYALETFASLQRGRSNESKPDFLVARIAETQGLIRQGNIQAADTGFRHRPIGSAIAGGFVRDPHSNGALGGPPFAMVPSNLWGEERVGQVDSALQDLDADLRKPAGLWVNRAGINGDGLKRDVGARTHFMNSVPDCTLGFMNEPFRDPNATNPFDKQFVPAQPFPWMAWNNRPFANSDELLQVPAFRSSLLMKTFSFAKTAGVTPLADTKGEYSESYSQKVRRGKYPRDRNFQQNFPELVVDGPYGHLPNYFRTQTDATNGNRDIVGLYRVLDYVHVPSRYVGIEQWLNPTEFSDGGTTVSTTDDPRYQRQPPLNQVSTYRDPGRVNLNTVTDHRVWDGGILHRELFDPNSAWNPIPGSGRNNYLGDSGHSGPFFVDGDPNSGFVPNPDLVSSRRGYPGVLSDNAANPGTTDSMLLLDPNSPTFFANPFRSSDAGDLVPFDLMRRAGLDCTVLRSSRGSGVDPNGPPLLYFERDSVEDVNPMDNVPDNPQYAGVDTERNSYLRYQPISRLSNLTTTRSNVYAVWITIGFFEVEEAPDINTFEAINDPMGNLTTAQRDALYARVYPEGYQLSRELGIDTGDIQRLRQFAIVDRSVPVAFEPGEDHNVERAVRLRRRIE